MIRFHLLRGAKDWLGHLILIAIPVILISFFYYLISNDIAGSEAELHLADITVFLSIGFILTFQIYSSANSYEVLHEDYLTPMKYRLIATPAIPGKLVFSIMLSGIIVSYLQSMAVLIFSILVLNASFKAMHLVLTILLISVIFHHLLAAVLLFWTRNDKKASAINTLYAIVAPMLLGLYFSMPDTRLFELFEKYLTPISLANTAIKGVLSDRPIDVIIGIVPLLLMSGVLFLMIKPLTRKVVTS